MTSSPCKPLSDGSSPVFNGGASPAEPREFQPTSLDELVEDGADLYKACKYDKLAALLVAGMTADTMIELSNSPSDTPHPSTINVRRLYSSCRGISDNLLVRNLPLRLQTRQGHGTSLQGIKIGGGDTHHFTTHDGNSSVVPYNQMPSLRIALFESTNSIYLVFPHLHNESRDSPDLTVAEYLAVWQRIILPSLKHSLPRSMYFGTAPPDGRSKIPTEVPFHLVGDFGKALKSNAEIASCEVPWMGDLTFYHDIVGVSRQYMVEDSVAAHTAMEEYLLDNGVSLDDVVVDSKEANGDWSIAVSINVSVPGKAVLWRSDYHAEVFKSLTKADLVTAPQNYQRFTLANLTTCEGFRFQCGNGFYAAFSDLEFSIDDLEFGGFDEVGRSLNKILGFHLIHAADGHDSFLHALSQLYAPLDCPISSTITARYPLDIAHEWMLPSDPALFARACNAYRPEVLWGWRSLRAFSFSHIIEKQRKHAFVVELRKSSSLAVAASITYLVNCLHVPEKETAALPLPASISADRGALFVDGLELGGSHNAPYCREIECHNNVPVDAFLGLLGLSSSDILLTYSTRSPGIPRPAPAFPSPRQVHSYRLFTPALGPQEAVTIFSDASDVISLISTRAPALSYSFPGLKAMIRMMQDLFFEDILLVAPTAKDQDKHLRYRSVRLTHKHPNLASPSHFLDDNLANVFNACSWKLATGAEWAEAFQRLFPPQGYKASRSAVQYTRTRYYKRWLHQSKIMDPIEFQVLRDAMWHTTFRDLYWVPLCSVHRIWTQDSQPGFKNFPPLLKGAPCVNVLINDARPPRFAPDTPVLLD